MLKISRLQMKRQQNGVRCVDRACAFWQRKRVSRPMLTTRPQNCEVVGGRLSRHFSVAARGFAKNVHRARFRFRSCWQDLCKENRMRMTLGT